MPLLCISIFVLLLLPQTQSCASQRPARELQGNMVIVLTHLVDTRENITASLSNINCSNLKHKFPNCTPGVEVSRDIDSFQRKVVEIIHNLACNMRKLGLSQTEQLSNAVIGSIQCPCHKSAKKHQEKSGMGKRRRRNEHHKTHKKLCKAKAILSSVTECYEMLNTLKDT